MQIPFSLEKMIGFSTFRVIFWVFLNFLLGGKGKGTCIRPGPNRVEKSTQVEVLIPARILNARPVSLPISTFTRSLGKRKIKKQNNFHKFCSVSQSGMSLIEDAERRVQGSRMLFCSWILLNLPRMPTFPTSLSLLRQTHHKCK